MAYGLRRLPKAAIWLAEGAKNNISQARRYFEQSSQEGDADGFTGLAWIN